MSPNDKINKGQRKNSSISGCAVMLGVKADTIEKMMPVLSLVDQYERTKDYAAREGLILAYSKLILDLQMEKFEASFDKKS
jgi:hypothetical protein